MKRPLILLMVLGLLMAFPATAGAGPDCDKKPDHPFCGGGYPPSGELTPGYPCDEAATPVTDDFTVTLTAANRSACIDVLSAGGDWNFTISTDGRVNMLWMVVKDSQPGDHCYQADLWRSTFPTSITRPVPAATINACDGLISPPDYDDTAPSLVYGAKMQGTGTVTIDVTLPNTPPSRSDLIR